MRTTHVITAGLATLALLLATTAVELAAQSRQPAADVSLNEDLLPGVTLGTQEVEPGVLQVVHDGHRDPSMVLAPYPEPDRRPFRSNLLAGLDGSVWAFGPDEFYRVGEEAAYPAGEHAPNRPVAAGGGSPGRLS